MSAYNAGDLCSIPGSGRSPEEGNGNPLQYSCLEKSHGQTSVVGYSPWVHKELDTTEQLHYSFFWEGSVLILFKYLVKLTYEIGFSFLDVWLLTQLLVFSDFYFSLLLLKWVVYLQDLVISSRLSNLLVYNFHRHIL